MIKKSDIIFTNLYGKRNPDINTAISMGDWKDTKKILKKGRQEIINTVKESGLRGRGGAGSLLV